MKLSKNELTQYFCFLLTHIFPYCYKKSFTDLRFHPIYPNYHWWKNPIPEILMKLYIFNITNSEEFIAGRDKTLKLQEIGPIIFVEETKHTDIVFHEENSTMSYTVNRRLIFKEDANVKGILNQTIIVTNMVLSGASFVSNKFLLKRTYNILLRTHGSKPIVSTTIYNYCFNLTDPVL